MSSMDLVEFLTARLDEAEQVARDAAVDSGGTWKPGAGVWGDLDEVHPVVYDEGRPTPDQAAHIARHDPARVLADIAAKRHVIAWCVEVIGGRDLSRYGEFDALRGVPEAMAVTLAVETLRGLALADADHPGYREEWKP